MIIKPARRGGFKAFSDYLAGEGGNAHENEAVNLISDSLGIGSINGFCIFASQAAEPRRQGKYPLRKPIEHISIRTRKGDILTPKMMQGKVPELLKKLGYANCPWILVQHIKGGEPHYHLGILRIDDKGRIPNPKSQGVCFDLAQKFARELGFKPSFGGAKASRYAQQKDHLARLWTATAQLSPADRLRAFAKAGLTVARHDRRAEIVFVDRYGKPHSLHRIPAIKALGLKPADITAAFGLDKRRLAALPSIKDVQTAIRRNANARRAANPSRAGRPPPQSVRGFGQIYRNPLPQLQTRGNPRTQRSSLGLLLLIVLGLSRRRERDELLGIRNQNSSGLNRKRAKRVNPKAPGAGGPKLRATMLSGVGYRAEGLYKSMIAAGISPEWAEKAAQAVFLDEEQRQAAEQRYLDWVQGATPQRGQQIPSNQPRR